MSCYDIFRSDGDEVQNEWIKHVQFIDELLEKTIIEMYTKQFHEFAVAITGRRNKPDDIK